MVRRSIYALAAFLAVAIPFAPADAAVLVFGGNRATGLETVKALRAMGEEVVVFVRPSSDLSALDGLNVGTVTGDALDPVSVKEAAASQRFSAIVSTIGGSRGEPRPDYEGTKNIADAAKAAGVERIVIVTAIGTGDSAGAVSADVHRVLGAVFAEKVKGEDYVKSSGLTYTIIRPGGLTDDPPTGNGMLTEDKTVGGDITRADLGKLVAETVGDTSTHNKVYSAFDKNKIAKGQMPARFGN